MAVFNKFNQYVEDLNNGVHNWSAHQMRVALSNTAPVAGNSVLADITEISYANLTGDPTSRNVTISASGQTAGVYSITTTDLVLTASADSLGPFQYVVHYNDTPASPLKPLIQWYVATAPVTLANGETFTIDYQATFYTLT